MFVFNSSIFAWLWQSGSDIADRIGVTAAWQEHVPAPIQNFFGQSSQAIQGFFNHSAVMWLIGSSGVTVGAHAALMEKPIETVFEEEV